MKWITEAWHPTGLKMFVPRCRYQNICHVKLNPLAALDRQYILTCISGALQAHLCKSSRIHIQLYLYCVRVDVSCLLMCYAFPSLFTFKNGFTIFSKVSSSIGGLEGVTDN